VDAEDFAVWKSNFGESIASVAEYGALPNDGNDDTAAIQRAIKANVNVYFPAGEYWTSSKFTVPSGRTLYGPDDDDRATIRVRFDLPSTANNYAFHIMGNDVVLQNLVIDKDFVDGSYAIGILAENRSNLKFVGLEIKDYSVRYGIHLIECHSFRISDTYVHDFMFNKSIVGANESDMIKDSPAGMRLTRSTNGIIANCLIQNIEVGPQGRASISELVPSYGPQGYQADGITLHDSSSILVENNVISNSGELIDLVVSDSCVVRNNDLQMAFLFVIKCIGSQSCVVQSNYVAHGAIGIFLADHSTEECTSNVVDGNDIVSCGSPGVWGIAAHNRLGFAISGIYLDNNVSGNTVSRNRVFDPQHYLTQYLRQGTGDNDCPDNEGTYGEFGSIAGVDLASNVSQLLLHITIIESTIPRHGCEEPNRYESQQYDCHSQLPHSAHEQSVGRSQEGREHNTRSDFCPMESSWW
jgi:parallel beta-helix repeat protein